MRKKINFILFVLIMCVFISVPVFSAENNQLVKPIKVVNLPNGQTVIIKEVHTNPIVAISTWVRTGSINEDNENNGVSHFLEHLFFKGTKNHPAGEMDKIIEATGAEYNAGTSKDYTSFYITTASKYFDTALELHSDMLLNASFPAEELEKERKVVVEEIRRSNDSPQRQVYFNLNDLVYKKHPYKYDTIGTSKIIENIPREKILDYYHKWYVPSNMTTVIVGDVDSDKAIELIKKYFGNQPVARMTLPEYEREPLLTRVEEKYDKGDYKQAYMEIGFRAPSMHELEESYALDVASIVLGSGRSSRLYKILKQEKNLITNLSVGNYTMKDDGLFIFDFDLEPKNVEIVKKITLEEIDRIKTTPITEEELNKAKNQVSRDFIYQNESVSNIASSIGYSVTLGKLENYLDYVDKINAVTIEDVQKAANKYLTTDKMAVSILEPNKIDKTKETKSIKTNDKPATDNTDNNKPLSNEDNLVTKYTLPNGITLLLKQNPINDVVSTNVYIKGGKSIENKPGISALVANLLLKGTKSRSAEDIANETEAVGIKLNAGANDDYIQVSCKSTKTDFPEAFLVLSDILKNADFKENEIAKVKKSMINSIIANQDSPLSYAIEKLYMNIYGDHPYGAVGEKVVKVLPEITRDEIVGYYDKYFTPGNMVISVVGNIPPELVKRYVEQTWKKNSEQNTFEPSQKVQPLKEDKIIETPKKTEAASVTIGWLAPQMGKQDYAALKVIDTLLGGGLSSKLAKVIREEKGMAYEVGSFYPSRMDKSVFVFYVGTEPKNINEVIRSFKIEAKKLQDEPISNEDLKDAKQRIIGQYALSHETNAAQANYLGWFESVGLGYEFDKDYPELINSVTPEQIQEVAKKVFTQPYVISIVAPQEALKTLEGK